jgi:hypothetical protein
MESFLARTVNRVRTFCQGMAPDKVAIGIPGLGVEIGREDGSALLKNNPVFREELARFATQQAPIFYRDAAANTQGNSRASSKRRTRNAPQGKNCPRHRFDGAFHRINIKGVYHRI